MNEIAMIFTNIFYRIHGYPETRTYGSSISMSKTIFWGWQELVTLKNKTDSQLVASGYMVFVVSLGIWLNSCFGYSADGMIQKIKIFGGK